MDDKIAARENTKRSKIIRIDKNINASQKISQKRSLIFDFSRFLSLDKGQFFFYDGLKRFFFMFLKHLYFYVCHK